ncbi:MAG: hypothetical protein IT204_00225 [Fimbriimonadaceae bacterium]|nr:hypothetical protein [Fimbriimonadaceae bacterium]
MTPAGAALRELITWLRDARVTAREVRGPLWTLTLDRPTGPAHLLWTTGDPLDHPLPAAWQATRWRRLDGRSGTPTSPLRLDGEPLLVE